MDDTDDRQKMAEDLKKALEDNARLQRGLDEANATMASMQSQAVIDGNEITRLRARQDMAPVPVSLTNVQTRDVADLPRLDQLPAAKPMPEEPSKGPMTAEEEVAAHIEKKRASLTQIVGRGFIADPSTDDPQPGSGEAAAVKEIEGAETA